MPVYIMFDHAISFEYKLNTDEYKLNTKLFEMNTKRFLIEIRFKSKSNPIQILTEIRQFLRADFSYPKIAVLFPRRFFSGISHQFFGGPKIRAEPSS